METTVVRCSLLALALLVAGCGYWGRQPIDQPAPVKPSTPVWIWSHDAVLKWHDVLITQDSVSGIPFGSPRDCFARCRRSIPRVQVDSIKQGYRTPAQNTITVVGVVIGLLSAEGAACYLAHLVDECP
jgi:hypothetical protein